MVFIVIMFIGQKHIKPIVANKTIVGIALGVSLLVTTFFTFNTYMFLPKIDFLPYKVGNDIGQLMTLPEGAKKDSVAMIFIYEKDGKRLELGVNDIGQIDDTYTFIDRVDKVIVEGDKAPIHDFKLFDINGVDYTDSLLMQKGFRIILVQTHIAKSRMGMEPQLAQLAADCQANGVGFWALTNTTLTEVEPYRHEHQLAFNYYNMDATPLKSIVRSNPGLVLLKDNVVIKKWSAYGIPTFDKVKLYMEGKVGPRGIRK